MGVFKQIKNKALAVNEKAAKKVDKQHLKIKKSLKQQRQLFKKDVLHRFQKIIDDAAVSERKITIECNETKLTTVKKAKRVRTVWTEEDDKSLKRYKNEQKPWKTISRLLDNNASVAACMYRYKNIK
jgi:hypothetical protein